MASQPEYEPAGLVRRFIAAILDWIGLFLTGFVAGLCLSLFAVDDPERFRSAVCLNIFSLVIALGYFWYFWTKKDGQTPGKTTMGLQVVKLDGSRINDVTAIMRFIGYGVNTLVFFLGWASIFSNPERRGWHDKIAGTMVVVASPDRQRSTPQESRRHSCFIVILLGFIGCLVAVIVIALLVPPQPKTFSSDGITLTYPGNWREMELHPDYEDYCQLPDVECLFNRGVGSPGKIPEVGFFIERLKSLSSSSPLTVRQVDEEYGRQVQAEIPGATLSSFQEIVIDGHAALQRDFVVPESGNERALKLIFIQDGSTVIYLRFEGTTQSFSEHKSEIESIINSLDFAS